MFELVEDSDEVPAMDPANQTEVQQITPRKSILKKNGTEGEIIKTENEEKRYSLNFSFSKNYKK